MAELWRNRAGNQRALVRVAHPTTEHELCRIVAEVAGRGGHLKAVGAGHAFSDVGLTGGVMVSLREYGRVLAFDPDEGLITVQAGATLNELARYLWTRGFAFENVGGAGSQTIAGAAATATHGTGISFPNVSAGIAAMRIVDGAGGVHDASPEGDSVLFAVGRVGVGALGIVSTVTLRVVPAFNVSTVEEPLPLGELVESFTDRVASHDHLEAFHVPGTGTILTRTRQRNDGPLRPTKPLLPPCRVERSTKGQYSMRTTEHHGPAHELLDTLRRTRFVEMEYAVPLEATMDALGEVCAWIERPDAPAVLQLAVSTSAADDVALSGASGRASGHISVRVHRRSAYEACFRVVEAIMRGHDGRPHWGKLHFRSADDLAPAYPQWDAFGAVRARMDPEGVFENAYTRRCLGPVT